MITYLAAPDAFDEAELWIEGDAYRHLFRARRLARGAELRIVDGAGRARRGEVLEVDRRRALVALGAPLQSVEPPVAVHLAVGALRAERAEWLVEKATELGVASLTFFASARSPRDYGDGRLKRWRRVAASALQQCGGARLPTLEGVLGWSDLLDRLKGPMETSARWVLAFDGAPFRDLRDAAAPRLAEVRCVIGPEGGLTPGELEQLDTLGVHRASLGPRVLRVETAALAAASLALAG
ncbi:MAG: RsmE family RNA methyltransferase [Acidobacteriota bacterium]